jgi:V8-like Glu-specific endopeptidase
MGSLYGHEKQVRRTTTSYAYTAHDFQSGHSGGPIYQYNGGNRKIVAIVKGKYSSLENRSVKIRGSVFDSLMAVMDAWPSSYCDDYGWTGAGCE